MTVVDALGALTILVRIEPEKDADDLGPLRSLLGSVQQPNVEREVLSIIIRQVGALRRLIVKGEAGHYADPVLLVGLDGLKRLRYGRRVSQGNNFSIRVERQPRDPLCGPDWAA